MPDKHLPLPPQDVIQSHVCQALSRYWPTHRLEPSMLPIPVVRPAAINAPLRLQLITLPDWGAVHGVVGALLVPVEACPQGNDWQSVDWWLAAFLLLECWHERTAELNHGPIHSYSFRLVGWDVRVWDHAWVNRIGLFLRIWAARTLGQSADQAFGGLPPVEILMTHDVDAVSKTRSIRFKQSTFNIFNSARHLMKGQMSAALDKAGVAVRFLFGCEDWWTIEQLLAQEKQAGIKAHYNFSADTRKKTLQRWLFDPSYDIESYRMRDLLCYIQEQGGVVGLHPTFDTWKSAPSIQQQRERLSIVAKTQVISCRQHWLRFSWRETWSAQIAAGIKHDTTLMFNDRSGFRASAALTWHPWNPSQSRPHSIIESPSVLMDSHFYDYQSMSDIDRKSAIQMWLREVEDVNGQIAVLWHPHTLTKDYGWNQGFQVLLETLRATRLCQHLQ